MRNWLKVLRARWFWFWVDLETKVRLAFLSEAQKKRNMEDLLSGGSKR